MCFKYFRVFQEKVLFIEFLEDDAYLKINNLLDLKKEMIKFKK